MGVGDNRRNDAPRLGDNKGSDGGLLADIDRGDEVVAKCQITGRESTSAPPLVPILWQVWIAMEEGYLQAGMSYLP